MDKWIDIREDKPPDKPVLVKVAGYEDVMMGKRVITTHRIYWKIQPFLFAWFTVDEDKDGFPIQQWSVFD